MRKLPVTPKKVVETKHPDPRSEVLRLLDQIEDEASEGLGPEDTASDAVVSKVRAAKRLLEACWQDFRLPEYKVRVFWSSSDAVVRAVGPEEAKNVALSVLPPPSANRVVVLKEDLDRKWQIVREFKTDLPGVES